MTRKDWKAFNEAEKCHICNKDLIRHNEKDERELWCPTGFYWGKAHRYKKEPIESNRPVRCYTSMMELLATDQNGKRLVRLPDLLSVFVVLVCDVLPCQSAVESLSWWKGSLTEPIH